MFENLNPANLITLFNGLKLPITVGGGGVLIFFYRFDFSFARFFFFCCFISFVAYLLDDFQTRCVPIIAQLHPPPYTLSVLEIDCRQHAKINLLVTSS